MTSCRRTRNCVMSSARCIPRFASANWSDTRWATPRKSKGDGMSGGKLSARYFSDLDAILDAGRKEGLPREDLLDATVAAGLRSVSLMVGDVA